MKTKILGRWVAILLPFIALIIYRRMKKHNAIDLIKRFEGSVKNSRGEHVAYQDQAGIWTIGYGNTTINGKPVKKGDVISEETAVKLLTDYVKKMEADLLKSLGYVPAPNQLAAILSMAYNIGTAGMKRSVTFAYAKKKEHRAAADAMLNWKYITVNGQKVVNRGLEARRKKEREIYLT